MTEREEFIKAFMKAAEPVQNRNLLNALYM